MNLSKIHYIAIILSDCKQPEFFYVNKLGFSIIGKTIERKDWKLDLVLMNTRNGDFRRGKPTEACVNDRRKPVGCVILRSAWMAWSRRWKELAEVKGICECVDD